MKTTFAIFFYLILIITATCFAQNVVPGTVGKDIKLSGLVMDSTLKLPLAYASIGIVNKPMGTVSDSLGYFDLIIGNEYLDDSLQVSVVGYYPLKKPIRELLKATDGITINLTKKVTQLKEVVVSNQFQHTLIIGRQSNGSLLQASIIPKGEKKLIIGAESGVKMQSKHYPALLNNFNFYLSANNFKYIKFRLNIYALKNNLPDTLLFNNDILISLKEFKTRWNQIDLTPYHLIVNADFAATLQWVDYNKNMVEEPRILIPVAVSLSHASYFRTSAQDKWNKVKGNCSYFIEVQY
jgi:hypothetical protein